MNTEPLPIHADDCECRSCIADQKIKEALLVGDAIYQSMKRECVVIPFPVNRTKARGEL